VSSAGRAPPPQTQHKGAVYGDDENAPRSQAGNRDSTRRCAADPSQHTPTGGPRAATPPGADRSTRQTGATVCICVGCCSRWHKSSLVLQVVVARRHMRDLGHGASRIRQRPAGQSWLPTGPSPLAARAAGRHRRRQYRRPPAVVAEHVVPPAPVLRRRCVTPHTELAPDGLTR
jgi:hypothetical protein